MSDPLTTRFELLGVLGQGGMGRVWRARDRVTGRDVALKQASEAPGAGAALRQEFWWMKRLRGPNLVEAYDFGVDEAGLAWLTMELLPGEPLEDRLPLPPDALERLARDTCRALRHLHDAGVVHGDVSLRNLRQGPDGAWRLLDLGLLTPVGQPATVRGTPDYMAPEVFQGAPLDGRADLYALGGVLFHAATGQAPFLAASTTELMRAHLQAPPPRPRALGAVVDEALEQLVVAMLAKDPASRPNPVSAVLAALGEATEPGPATLVCAPFVGREAELARFEAGLAALRATRSGEAWGLEGPPGVGRTRLLDEMAARAQLAELPVLRAAGDPSGAPYHPFAQLLRQAWPQLLGDEPDLLAVHAAALHPLLPERVPVAERYTLEPQAAKLRVMAALIELFVAFVQRRGLVLLLDDWHLADSLSREVLDALLRHLRGEPLVLVATEREGARPAEAWPRQALAPLGPREVGRLVAATFGRAEVPGAFVNQVCELSGGSPRAVETLLASWAEAGAIAQVEGRWQLAPLPPAVIARGLGLGLDERFSGLSEVARHVLLRFAVARTALDLPLFEALTGSWTDEVRFAALAELEHARLLAPQGEGLVLQSRHLVEAWREAAPEEERRAAHREVAAAVQARYPVVRQRALETALIPSLEALDDEEGTAALLVPVAEHLLAAGSRYEGAIHALAAARHLAGMYDLARASSLATEGRAALAGAAEGGWPLADRPVWACAYEVLQGDLLRLSNRFEEADARYAEAELLARGVSVPSPPLAGLRARALVGGGVVRQTRGDHEGASTMLREALPLAQALPVAREELRCLAALGRSHYQLGDRARAAEVYEEALARAEAVGDAAYRGECLAFLGYLDVSDEGTGVQATPTGRGVARLREAIDLQQRVGDPLSLNDSHMLLGNALLQLGDLRGAEHAFLRNRSLCQELGFFEEVTACLNLAIVALDRGDAAQGCALAQDAQRLARGASDGFLEDLGIALEARAWSALGHLGQALELVGASFVRRQQAEDAYGELFVGLIEAEVAMELGRLEHADARALELLEAQARSGITEFALAVATLTARLAAARGQHGVALSGLQEALTRASQRGAAWWEARISLAIGKVLVAEGDLGEAERWLSRGEECAEACDAPGLLMRAWYHRGRLARLCGHAVEADAFQQRALEVAVGAGLPEWRALIAHERGLAQFPSPRSGRWAREAQAALTVIVADLDEGLKPDYLAVSPRQAILDRNLAVEAGGERVRVGADQGRGPGWLDQPEGAAARDELTRQRRWFEELQRTAERLQAQLDFSQALQELDGEEPIAQRALALLIDLVGAARVDFLAFEGLRLVARASRSAPHQAPIEEDWTFHADLVVEAAHSGVVFYDPDRQDPVVGRRAVLALPLGDARERWGLVLALGHPGSHPPLDPGDLDSLRVLSGSLLAALRRSRLEAEWRAKTHRLEMLYQLSSKVTSTLVMAEVLEMVLAFSLEVTQAERGCVFLLDEAGTLRSEAAITGPGVREAAPTSDTVSQSILRRVQESGEALWVEDTQDDAVLRHQKSIQDLNLRSVLAVPLAIHQRIIGVLYVDSRVVVNAFTALDLEMLRAIASHAAVALENARLYELATVDRLTRLFFRSHFERRLREELRRATRTGSEMSLLMMDIDHFKKFNDTYGHAVGDLVLAHVAGLIRANVRQDVDVPCRYGGEEMVVLLPETDARGATVFAERVRRAIDETPLVTEAHGALHVTISIGTSTCPQDGEDGLTLMELADRALYVSKRAGRNRVTTWREGIGS